MIISAFLTLIALAPPTDVLDFMCPLDVISDGMKVSVAPLIPKEGFVPARGDRAFITGISKFRGVYSLCDAARSDAARADLLGAQEIGDRFGVEELRRAGSVVSVSPGTPVLVIELSKSMKGGDFAVVRPETGDLVGVKLWVPLKDLKQFSKNPNWDRTLAPVANPDPPAKPKASGAKSEKAKAESAKRAAKSAALLRIAKALEKAGKTDGALARYREIIKDYKNMPEAKEAAERVKALTKG